jgi:D-glycero-alpha-D-manno-heptose-7-phosphate kinase
MIISQAPLRVSLFGGGSDLPAFLANNDGAVLSFAINKHVYLVAHPFVHRKGIALKYSKTEDVNDSTEIRHPIFREVLTAYGVKDLDIAVMSDVPAGTGLGSSSAFTVSLLALVKSLCGVKFSARDLALEACDVEINRIGEPIGYQDQWASALGGINLIHFKGLSKVEVEAIHLRSENLEKLNRSLRLIPIGNPRSAGKLLLEQSQLLAVEKTAQYATRRLVELVDLGKNAIENEIDALGELLTEGWALKKEISPSTTNEKVDYVIDRTREFGSTGAKLLGAGGSGYVACYVPEDRHSDFDLQFKNQLDFSIEMKGAGVLHGA